MLGVIKIWLQGWKSYWKGIDLTLEFHNCANWFCICLLSSVKVEGKMQVVDIFKNGEIWILHQQRMSETNI